MLLSIATATLYTQPFEQVLEMIAEAGFRHIELDLPWERKEWAMAQHLIGMPVKQVVQLIERSGLKVASIHDGGGVLEDANSTAGYINPLLERYLDEMGYIPECLVFHTPHIEGTQDETWWQRISGQIIHSLERYCQLCSHVTIENCPFFDGYHVPITRPEELKAFVEENGLGVTIDTTHYAEIGVDIIKAAQKIGENVKTIHLSDFAGSRRHVFVGDGKLDLSGFFDVVDKGSLRAVTLECSLSTADVPQQEMSREELVGRMKEAHQRCHAWGLGFSSDDAG